VRDRDQRDDRLHHGNLPLIFFLFVCYTDWFWTPLFAYYDRRVRALTG
jgi:hypothetical protein